MELLRSVALCCRDRNLHVTVTRNTSSPSDIFLKHFPFSITVLQNSSPRGFGANHNQAFAHCKEEYFCVVNPDIVLKTDPFDSLISCLSNQKIGLVAPALVDSEGKLQDSARLFPTPGRIFRRVFSGAEKKYTAPSSVQAIFPDWVAGMFMLFPAHVYREINGFDEQYFMYCEDADICMRLAEQGYRTQFVPQVQAIHNPRRASHGTIRHMSWHVLSLLRFFCRYPFYRL